MDVDVDECMQVKRQIVSNNEIPEGIVCNIS